MASKFHGEFEVTVDFVNKHVAEDVDLVLGDWVLVGAYRGRGCVGSYVTLYSVDSTRRYALDFLGLCIRHDYAYRYDYDYELWHVVATPEWMPAQRYTLNYIELLDHVGRGLFDETLVLCDFEEVPGNGFVVCRTSLGFYAPTDCQSEFPRTLGEFVEWGSYDFVEVDAENDYFAWVPMAEIDVFCNICELLVSHGLDWCDLQRLRFNGDVLRRNVSA